MTMSNFMSFYHPENVILSPRKCHFITPKMSFYVLCKSCGSRSTEHLKYIKIYIKYIIKRRYSKFFKKSPHFYVGTEKVLIKQNKKYCNKYQKIL